MDKFLKIISTITNKTHLKIFWAYYSIHLPLNHFQQNILQEIGYLELNLPILLQGYHRG